MQDQAPLPLENIQAGKRDPVAVEMVNHPKHYNAHPSGVECIEVIRHMIHNRGAAIKYIWRAGEKDPTKEIEDLKKAIWYIQDEIKRLENKNGNS